MLDSRLSMPSKNIPCEKLIKRQKAPTAPVGTSKGKINADGDLLWEI